MILKRNWTKFRLVKRNFVWPNEISFDQTKFRSITFQNHGGLRNHFWKKLKHKELENSTSFGETKLSLEKRNFVQLLLIVLEDMPKKKCNFELKVYNSLGFYLMLELTILLDQLSGVSRREHHQRPWWSTSVSILQQNRL